MTELSPRASRVLDALHQAWEEGNVDAFDTILSADYVRRGQRLQQSRDELKTSVGAMHAAFPDMTMTIDGVVESEDQLAVLWSSTGTQRDVYLDQPPSGRPYAVSGATLSTFRGDEIIEERVLFDRRGGYNSAGVPLGRSSRPGPDSDAEHLPDVSSEDLRAFHQTLVTGVTVVAISTDGTPRGLAVNAFSSVSLEPPLVLVCVQKSSSTYSSLVAAQHFSINVLAADQLAVAGVFASKIADKFAQVDWRPGIGDAPIIAGATATLEVALEETLHARTHTIFIGRVVGASHSGKPALVYTGGRFFDGGALVEVDPR